MVSTGYLSVVDRLEMLLQAKLGPVLGFFVEDQEADTRQYYNFFNKKTIATVRWREHTRRPQLNRETV